MKHCAFAVRTHADIPVIAQCVWNDGKRLAVHGHCEGLVTASPRRPFLIAESKLLSVRLNPDKALKAPMKFDLDLVGEDKPQLIEIRNGVLIHENASAEKGNTAW